jgi:hypothetical protein
MATVWSSVTKEAAIVLSNGGLTALCGTGRSYSPGACDTFITAGQLIYFEVHLDVLSQLGATAVGIANASNSYALGQYLGRSNNSIGYFDDGTLIRNDVTLATFTVPVVGDTIGVAVKSGDKAWFRLNGVWQSGDPNTLTGGTDISTLGDVNPAYSVVGTVVETQNTANFGATALQSAKPTGFSTLDTIPVPPTPPAAPTGGGPALYPKRHWLTEAGVSQKRRDEEDEDALATLLMLQ